MQRSTLEVCTSCCSIWKRFGEIYHNLIRASLKYHHLPNIFTDIFNSIYDGAQVAISVNDQWTNQIRVQRGVLQGDPSSPIIFNLCFNSLMKTLTQPHLMSLGYKISESREKSRSVSWLQFADDATVISGDLKSCQALLNIFCAWCEWAKHDY